MEISSPPLTRLIGELINILCKALWGSVRKILCNFSIIHGPSGSSGCLSPGKRDFYLLSCLSQYKNKVFLLLFVALKISCNRTCSGCSHHRARALAPPRGPAPEAERDWTSLSSWLLWGCFATHPHPVVFCVCQPVEWQNPILNPLLFSRLSSCSCSSLFWDGSEGTVHRAIQFFSCNILFILLTFQHPASSKASVRTSIFLAILYWQLHKYCFDSAVPFWSWSGVFHS